jgi:hypothetical protein
MTMNLIPFLVVWSILGASVVALIVYRTLLAKNEDDSIHLAEGTTMKEQVTLSHKLDVVDHWGKILTATAVTAGFLLLIMYGYQLWSQPVGMH